MNLQPKSKTIDHLFYVILAVKLCVMLVFSSDYQNALFIPFVEHFLANFDNPWAYIYHNPQTGIEFPYSPVMLYILSIFYAPVFLLKSEAQWVMNLFMKLPTLLADLMIYRLLLSIVDDKKKVLLYYFSAPIVIYACYMHSQVDLIPTALLFGSVFFLTRKSVLWSAVFLGLAMGAKFHVAAAMPLMVVYIYRRMRVIDLLQFCLTVPLVFMFIIFPYYGEAFRMTVLSNPKQMLVYDSFIQIGSLKLYLPILLVTVFYARFAAFRKINTDLFFMFLTLGFAAFIMLTNPAPGWFVWLFPFISIFFIKHEHMAREIRKLYFALNGCYLVYMVFFFIPDHVDLIMGTEIVDLKIENEKLRNIAFTLLEVTLLAAMYSCYKFGVRSNFFYRRTAPTVIGIAGDSAAGKTTLLNDMNDLLGEKILKLEGDADHKWERNDENWKEMTHLNPKANELYQQYEDLVNLRYGTSVYRADYDHDTGRFTEQQKIRAKDYIVLSGLHAFYLPKMRKIIDLKIYIDTDEKLRRHWKVSRDVKERGYSPDDVLKNMDKRVPDAKRFIHPQQEYADLVISYFTDKDIRPGETEGASPKLKLTLDSNLPLHQVVAYLEQHVGVIWDYAEDMATQSIIIDGTVKAHQVRSLAAQTIINLEDLISEEPVWLDGVRGLAQFFVLFNLSEIIRAEQKG